MKNNTKIIAFYNEKGGVAKTTSVVSIGAGLKILGKKPLLVDLDPQAHTTLHLGFDPSKQKSSVYDLLHGNADLGDVILNRDGLYLVPASERLSGISRELGGDVSWQFILRDALTPLNDAFHYVLIDCPADLGFITINALTAATEVYIPVQTQYFALEGLTRLIRNVERIKRGLNPGLKVTGIFGTLHDENYRLNKAVMESVTNSLGNVMFNTIIRRKTKIAEAPSHGQTIFEYAPKTAGARDYLNLCKEILQRETVKSESTHG